MNEIRDLIGEYERAERLRHRGWRQAFAGAVLWTGAVLLGILALAWAVAWRVAIVAGGLWIAWRFLGVFR